MNFKEKILKNLRVLGIEEYADQMIIYLEDSETGDQYKLVIWIEPDDYVPEDVLEHLYLCYDLERC